HYLSQPSIPLYLPNKFFPEKEMREGGRFIGLFLDEDKSVHHYRIEKVEHLSGDYFKLVAEDVAGNAVNRLTGRPLMQLGSTFLMPSNSVGFWDGYYLDPSSTKKLKTNEPQGIVTYTDLPGTAIAVADHIGLLQKLLTYVKMSKTQFRGASVYITNEQQ